MPARHRSPLLLLALMAGIFPARGADPGESTYLENLPLVLSASRLPQSLEEAPGAITLITRDLILASGYRDLPRILRLVPGMQVGQERGHSFWVTYHGLGNTTPSEMQVMIDGNSVYSPSSFGGVNWNALPLTLDDIDRIEVVRGTNATTYGANAVLGVVNIITRHSAETTGFTSRLRQGNQGVADQVATWSGNSNGLSARLSARFNHDSGFDGLDDSNQSNAVTLRGDYQLSTADSLMLRAGFSFGQAGEGYQNTVFDNNAHRTATHHAQTLHFQWRRAPTPGRELLVNYYHNQEDINDSWLANAPSYPHVPLNRDRNASRDHVDVQYRFQWDPAWQLVWGAEAQRDEVDAPFLFANGNPPDQTLYRLFANMEWRVRKDLSVNLGGSAEKFRDAPERYNPRVFVNWQATSSQTLRAGYAEADRAINLFEVYGDIRAVDPATGRVLVRPYLANPDLKQTHIKSAELGYLGRFETGASVLDVRLFEERLEDFVVREPVTPEGPTPFLAPSLPSTHYTNVDGAVTLRGIEYQASTHPWPGGELVLTHTLIDRKTSDRNVETRTSPYTASLTWRQDWPRNVRSMISVLRMGPLAGGDGFVPRSEYVADPYTTVDANVDWHTLIGRTPVKVALTGINLGSRHQEIPDRSAQFLAPDKPLNLTSPTVYLTLSVGL